MTAIVGIAPLAIPSTPDPSKKKAGDTAMPSPVASSAPAPEVGRMAEAAPPHAPRRRASAWEESISSWRERAKECVTSNNLWSGRGTDGVEDGLMLSCSPVSTVMVCSSLSAPPSLPSSDFFSSSFSFFASSRAFPFIASTASRSRRFFQMASSTIMALSPILCKSNICFRFIPSWWSDSPVLGAHLTWTERSFHGASGCSERTERRASIGYCRRARSRSTSRLRRASVSSTSFKERCRSASAVDTRLGVPYVNRTDPPPFSKTTFQGRTSPPRSPAAPHLPTSPETNFLRTAHANRAFNSRGEWDFSREIS
mmetsp:Transcript_3059/g.6121  ORF Transcript_3059/g.6121 Transcript_3059/m.6121 type:complete len:312 (+) Transcript_3059:1145-2080(+)